MVPNSLPQQRPLPIWFNALLLLDAFVVGGLTALVLVNRLLQDIMYRSIAMSPDLLNALDHLLPYLAFYFAALVLLAWITGGTFLWLRTRARVALALTVIGPPVLCVGLVVLR